MNFEKIPLSARESKRPPQREEIRERKKEKEKDKEKEKEIQAVAGRSFPMIIREGGGMRDVFHEKVEEDMEAMATSSLPSIPSSFPPHGFKSGSAISFPDYQKKDLANEGEDEESERSEKFRSLKKLAISDEGFINPRSSMISLGSNRKSLPFPEEAFQDITFNEPFPLSSGIRLRKRSKSLSPRDIAIQKYKIFGLQKGQIRKIEKDIARESIFLANQVELLPFYVCMNTMVEHFVWEQIEDNFTRKKQAFLEKEEMIAYYNSDQMVEISHKILEEEKLRALNWLELLVNKGILVNYIKERFRFFDQKIEEGLKKEQEKRGEIEPLFEEEMEGIRNFLKTIINSKYVRFKPFLIFLKEKGKDRNYGFLMWAMLGGEDHTELFNFEKRLTASLLMDYVKAWLWVELSKNNILMYGKKKWVEEMVIGKTEKGKEKKQTGKKNKKKVRINQIGSNKISRSIWGPDTGCPLLNLIIQNHPIQVTAEQLKNDPLIADSINPRFVIDRKNYLKNFLRALAENGFDFRSFDPRDERELDMQAFLFLSGLNIEGNKILRGVSLEALACSVRQVVVGNYPNIFSDKESSNKFQFHTHDIHPETVDCDIKILNPSLFTIHRDIYYETRLKRKGKDDSANEIGLIDFNFSWAFVGTISEKSHEPSWKGKFIMQNIKHKKGAPLLVLYHLFMGMDPRFAPLSKARREK